MITPQLAGKFFTGISPGLAANPHFVNAMVTASRQCDLQASEHIYDVNGMLLWAGGKPIDEHLLERLVDRPLRKPIELCVQARDPVAAVAAADIIERLAQEQSDLQALLGPGLAEICKTLRHTVPNPVELMFLSVLRHGGVDRVEHACLVAGIALGVAGLQQLPDNLRVAIARAGLLHDIGELYLPEPCLLRGPQHHTAEARQYQAHVQLGSRIATEVTRSGAVVAGLIGASHERLDGWGYPQGLSAPQLAEPAQAMLFAETMASQWEQLQVNRLRRTAVSLRLIPGEFPRYIVDWVSGASKAVPIETDLDAIPESLDQELKHLHVVLERIEHLFGEARHETAAVSAHIQVWQQRFLGLAGILRSAGVAEAVAQAVKCDAPDPREAIELASVCETLRDRIRSGRLRIESQRDDDPDLGMSVFTQELLEALYACDIELAGTSESSGRPLALPWSRIFRVGVTEIDDQHQTIVRMINQLHAAKVNGDDIRREVIIGLAEYVAVHFATEARLMSAYHYPQSDSHHREHDAFSRSVAQLVEGLARGEVPDMDALIRFLRHWLIVHILESDMALGRALNALGVD